ncbi:MAG: methyltransferase domain-containing protein [Patescibacteria group bacterium]|jgi:16S rRNA (adenine(1408)-N(1))-methyltransferase
MPGIIVDIGTGDGKFTYELAKANPDRFIIGVDPHHKSLEEISRKIDKKPAKGGIKNALFVLAAVEDLPAELAGLANQVFINFPWGSLLRGIILVEDKTWQSIKGICQTGALVDVVLGYNQEYEQKETGDLPALNLEYIKTVMSPRLQSLGFSLLEAREILKSDLADYPSSWSKKLIFGSNRNYYYFRLKLR